VDVARVDASSKDLGFIIEFASTLPSAFFSESAEVAFNLIGFAD